MWLLGLETSTVVSLRLAKLSAGGEASSKEAMLMVTEKVRSSMDLLAQAASSQLGATPLARTNAVIRHYRREVSANRQRLSR